MLRITAILLLASTIWVQTPVAQLLKIATLIEHYYEHKHENSNLSIAGYLHMHYVHDVDDHPGHDRDMQLPFKQCSPASLFVVIFFEQVKLDLPEKIAYTAITQPLSQYTFPHHATEAFSKIWQPPRA